MTNSNLDQYVADELLAMEKFRINDRSYDFPIMGSGISITLVSSNRKEKFALDISRGMQNRFKASFQNRGRQTIVLARLDLGGSPHRNPDGKKIESPHLHLYKEGFGDRWAYPVPPEHFNALSDLFRSLKDFMEYCKIVNSPTIRRGLFT